MLAVKGALSSRGGGLIMLMRIFSAGNKAGANFTEVIADSGEVREEIVIIFRFILRLF